MHIAIRAAGFSLMTMFVSCGVGAQGMGIGIGKVTMDGTLPGHESVARLCLSSIDDHFDKRWEPDTTMPLE